jgi:hypothetical protein
MVDQVETTVPTTSSRFFTGGNHGDERSEWVSQQFRNLKDVVNEDVRNLKDVTNGDFKDLRNQMQRDYSDLTNTVQTVGSAGILEGEKTAAAINLAVEKTAAAGQLSVEKTAAASQLTMEKNSAAGQLVSSVGFANTQNMMISGFKDGRYDASQNTASVQQYAAVNATATGLAFKDAAILALQNKADSDAKAAECCCEIKTLVISDGEKTRSLISSIDRERLRDSLASREAEIIYLKGKLGTGITA